MEKVHVNYLYCKTKFEKPETGVDFHIWNDFVVDMHWHDYYEFTLITKGKVDYDLNGERVLISVGDLLYVKPGDCHGMFSYDKESWQHINIAISEEMLKKICAGISDDFYNRVCEYPSGVYSLGSKESDVLKERVSMQESSLLDDVASLKIWVIMALSCLLSKPSNAYISNSNNTYPKWFLDGLELLKSEQYISQTGENIWSLFPCCYATLCKYFNKYVQDTPNGYFQKIKLQYAKKLLTVSNLTILEIANEIGLLSPSHFSKLFKKTYGYTPEQYRKKYSNMKSQNHV